MMILRSKMTKLFFLFLVLMAVSCASPVKKAIVLDPEAQNVEWGKRLSSEDCQVVGQVLGEADSGLADVARTDARNQVAKLKGNFLLVKDEVVNGGHWKISGIAYRCP